MLTHHMTNQTVLQFEVLYWEFLYQEIHWSLFLLAELTYR